MNETSIHTEEGQVVKRHVFNAAFERHLSPDPILSHIYYAPRTLLLKSEVEEIVACHLSELKAWSSSLTPHYLYVEMGYYPLVYSYVATTAPWKKYPGADVLLQPCELSRVTMFTNNATTQKNGWITFSYHD
jgi:hypothetical protein